MKTEDDIIAEIDQINESIRCLDDLIEQNWRTTPYVTREGVLNAGKLLSKHRRELYEQLKLMKENTNDE